MASVDNRIVQMTFDNATFEQKIATTIQSLENLNKKIDVGGLGKLSDAANKVNLGGLSGAVDGVSAKFLALSTIGITALANITSRAVDSALQISSAFTVAPITQGFQEYELKMGSIQTIMAGTGASLEEVNAKLAELNTYSDKTIYSFADMTSNIGKFTNAGVSLDMSVAAIQGVANVAARSGANANEASRAMYNFGQALGQGSVKLIDWKSIELANMGTVEFKDQLIDAALAAGTLTKAADGTITSLEGTEVTTKNFGTTLADAWLTSEVLVDTLGRYSDVSTDIGKAATANATEVKTFSQLLDTVKESIGSGWAQSFELMIGDFDAAKALMTNINDTIGEFVGKNADARNAVLETFVSFGGRTAIINSVKNAFAALGAILTPIKEAFRDIFPAKSGRELAMMAQTFEKFTASLIPSEGTIDKIGRTFKGLFAVLDIGFEIVKGVWGLFKDLFTTIAGPSSGAILDVTANFGDFLVGLRDILVDGGKIKEWFASLKEFIKDPLPALQELIEKIDEFLRGLGVNVPDIWSKITEGADQVKAKIEEALGPNIIAGLENGLERGKEVVTKFAQDIIDAVKDKLGIKSPSTVFQEIGGFIVEGLIKGLEAGMALITGVFDALVEADAFDKAAKAAKVLLSIVRSIFDKFREVFRFPPLATLFAFGAAASSGGIFLMLKRLSDFFGKKGLGAIKDSVIDTLEGVKGVLSAMALDIKAGALLKIAGAVGILALSLTLLAFIDGDKMAKSIAALSAAFTQLIASFAVLQKLSTNPKSAFNMAALAIGLGLLAGAILLLSASVLIFSMMDWEELGRGMAGVGAALTLLVGFVKGVEKSTVSLIAVGAGIAVIAVAMLLLAGAVRLFATMNPEQLGKGLGSVAIGLGLIAAAVNLFPSDMGARTAGMLALSGSMLLLAVAMKLMATMSWEEIGKGLVGVGGGLAALTLALKIIPEKNLNRLALTIMALSISMLFIAKAMEQLGQLKFTDILKSVFAIITTMTALSVAVRAMEGGLKGGIALILVTKSLGMLKDVLIQFAVIGWGTLIDGMAKLGLALTGLGVAAFYLGPVAPGLLVFGAALLLLGVGFAAIGAGANLFAKAIQIVVKTGPKGAEAVKMLIRGIGQALPLLIEGFARGLIEMAKVFIEQAPVFVELIGTLLGLVFDKIIELAPKFGETLKVLVETGIKVLTEVVPQFATMGLQILIGVLQGIRDNLDEIVTTVFQIVETFMTSLTENIPTLVDPTVALITAFLSSVAEALGKLSTTLMVSVGISFMEGFWEGIKESFGKMKDFIGGLINALIDFFKSLLGISSPSTVMMEIGVFVIEGLWEGIKLAWKLVEKFFIEVPGKLLGWFANGATWLLNKGKDIITGLKNGIDSMWETVKTWFTEMPGKIKSAIGSLYETLKDKGLDLLIGLKNGITNKWEDVKGWLSDIPEKIKSAIGSLYETLKTTGKNLIIGLWNGIADKLGWIKDQISGFAGNVIGWMKDRFKIGSPSKVTIYYGEMLGEGLIRGLQSTSKRTDATGTMMVENLSTAMNRAMTNLTNDLNNSADFNPKITPVLDLSNVVSGAGQIGRLLPTAAYSYGQAASIASTRFDAEQQLLNAEPATVKFEQNVYAPEQLSTADMYRQSRNLITLAKDELGIT